MSGEPVPQEPQPPVDDFERRKALLAFLTTTDADGNVLVWAEQWDEPGDLAEMELLVEVMDEWLLWAREVIRSSREIGLPYPPEKE